MEQKVEAIISQNLIELRKNKNLKQSELSEAVGYSDKTISRWENGTSVPDIATLITLAEFYNVTVTDLITENAVQKIVGEEKTEQEKIAKTFTSLAFSIMTTWLFAAIVYIGTFALVIPPIWECFIFAIPVSSVLAYRSVCKLYTIKWLNFLLWSLVILGLLVSVFLILTRYDLYFWQMYLLAIPLEGMCAINTLFKKPQKTVKKKSILK